MSLHRRAAKRDASEREIVEMLEACGWRVLKVSVKDGPDLIAAKGWTQYEWPSNRSRTVAIEIKTGRAKLKAGQSAWMDSWPGEKAVLRNAEEVKEL